MRRHRRYLKHEFPVLSEDDLKSFLRELLESGEKIKTENFKLKKYESRTLEPGIIGYFTVEKVIYKAGKHDKKGLAISYIIEEV